MGPPGVPQLSLFGGMPPPAIEDLGAPCATNCASWLCPWQQASNDVSLWPFAAPYPPIRGLLEGEGALGANSERLQSGLGALQNRLGAVTGGWKHGLGGAMGLRTCLQVELEEERGGGGGGL